MPNLLSKQKSVKDLRHYITPNQVMQGVLISIKLKNLLASPAFLFFNHRTLPSGTGADKFSLVENTAAPHHTHTHKKLLPWGESDARSSSTLNTNANHFIHGIKFQPKENVLALF